MMNANPVVTALLKKQREKFNPESEDYDYDTAHFYGMGPNGVGENLGHYGSVAPVDEGTRVLYGLPEESYLILKGRSHPTFYKAVEAEQNRGFEIIKRGDRYYSVPRGHIP